MQKWPALTQSSQTTRDKPGPRQVKARGQSHVGYRTGLPSDQLPQNVISIVVVVMARDYFLAFSRGRRYFQI